MTTHTLGQKALIGLERRGISPETAIRFGLYTASGAPGHAVNADPSGNVIVFPFSEHGRVVNEKYRAPGKVFWQSKGGRRTFWNSDILDDPALEAGTYPLIITEGEIDALTAIDCGFPFTVSVPDGAPPPMKGEPVDAIDPKADETGKFEFIWNNRDRIRKVKRFVLAVDADDAGKRLAGELARRFSAARCMFITYPSEMVVDDKNGGKRSCKDLNEVLVHFGRDRVSSVLNSARPYPIKGVYRLSDYPPAAQLETMAIGIGALDDFVRIFSGELMVVTGIPGHGKSSFMTNVLISIAEQYGVRSAIFSPEMPVMPQYRDKFRRIRCRGQPKNEGEEIAADAFIDEYFRFIDTGRENEDGDDMTLEWIIERAIDAVVRDNVKILLIDPWNEVEHAKRRDESMGEYVGRGIRALKSFARIRNVAVIIIAHPTKDVQEKGKGRMPTPYDISDSAHWFNKPDHILIVHRPDEANDITEVRIAKVRFEGTGKKGVVQLRFNQWSGWYDALDARYREAAE